MYIHLCSMFAHALMEVGVQQSTRRRLLRHVSLGFWRLRAGRNDTNILLGSDCNVKMSSDHDHGPSSCLSPPQEDESKIVYSRIVMLVGKAWKAVNLYY